MIDILSPRRLSTARYYFSIRNVRVGVVLGCHCECRNIGMIKVNLHIHVYLSL